MIWWWRSFFLALDSNSINWRFWWVSRVADLVTDGPDCLPPVLSVCPVFGYFWNCAGQWVDGWTPIHTWLTAPVESCAVVLFLREYIIYWLDTHSMSFSSKVELPEANCPTVLAAGFVSSCCCCQSFHHQEMTARAGGSLLLPRSREKWQRETLIPLSWLHAAAVDSSGNAISARHLGRLISSSARYYIIPADSRAAFFKKDATTHHLFPFYTVDCFEGK